MAEKAAVVTNVTEYAGAPAAMALAADGFAVLCHDPSFIGTEARAAFETSRPGCVAAAAQEPEALVAEAVARLGRLDALVSNDPWPARRLRIGEATPEEYRATIEALMVTPFRLAAAAARVMEGQGGGRIVLVTSAAPLRPYPGFSMYASARAGASGLAQALGKELGAANIQVNAVAPNFLYSETYYPKTQWADDPKYVERLKRMVPMQRLGRPEEVGALIAFLASGKADFVTAQVIPFTGGWP
jgi:NAD(P)-dependent dehydrogenase (short-subunit alcohol dehydrogenase family)